MDSENTSFQMPVQPLYGGGYGNNGGFGFGGDWSWILLLVLLCGGGWGGGFGGWGMGGFGNMALGYDFPWLLNGQNQINANTNAGFDHAATQAAIGNLSTAVTAGFGDVATQLCGGFAGVNATVNGAQNALAQQLYANQIADLERSFAAQTASTQGMNSIAMNLQNCCCENRSNIADLKYTVATENCADRAAISDGIRDLLAATQAQTQTILTQLCNDKLEQKNDTIAQLRSQVNELSRQASQTAQNAFISQGFANEVDALYNRLNSCPVPTTPVYGRTPIFTCNQQAGCGCNGGFVN